MASDDDIFFNPLLISLVGIIGTSLSIIVYHFFLSKCIRRPQTATNSAAQPNPQPNGPTGVEEKVLRTIPIFTLSALKTDDLSIDQGECVVCLGELEDDDMVRLLPDCKHAFHVTCIDQWFAQHANCPLCRSPIIAQNYDDSNSNSSSPASYTTAIESGTIDCTETPSSSSSTGVRSFGLLRHCASFVWPPPVERRSSSSRLNSGLKRSLSMDQFFVVIDLRRESENSTNSSSSSSSRCELTRSKSYWTHYDRMSSKLLRSFSRLRIAKGNSSSSAILPY